MRGKEALTRFSLIVKSTETFKTKMGNDIITESILIAGAKKKVINDNEFRGKMR